MSNKMIVKLMTNLINKKFYNTKDEAVTKLDVYFALGRITEEEYAELALLAEDMYEPKVVEDMEDVVIEEPSKEVIENEMVEEPKEENIEEESSEEIVEE